MEFCYKDDQQWAHTSQDHPRQIILYCQLGFSDTALHSCVKILPLVGGDGIRRWSVWGNDWLSRQRPDGWMYSVLMK